MAKQKRINLGNHILLREKLNLVTEIDKRGGAHDVFRCKNCLEKIKVYGLQRPKEVVGPCYVTKERKAEIEKKEETEKQKNGIVIGAWSAGGSVCPECSTVMILCPKKGHPNSKYWSLKRDDGCDLYICRTGCLEQQN